MSTDDDDFDILEGLGREGISVSQTRVNWIRPACNGIHTASEVISEHADLRLLKKARIRVGQLYYRLKLQPAKLPKCIVAMAPAIWQLNVSGLITPTGV